MYLQEAKISFNVNDIRSNLALGGARASLFQVYFSNPANPAANLKVPFLAKATEVPEAAIGTIQVPYFGRKIKLPGDRVYGTWTIQVLNDEDFAIRNALETWHNFINTPEGNLRNFSSAGPDQFETDATVQQFSKTGAVIREYKIHNIWPSRLSQLGLDWNSTDTIQEFTCTFEFDYYTVSGGITGDGGSNA